MNIGIGYLFGARDNGLTRAISALRGGITGTTSAIGAANTAAGNFAKNFGDAIRGLQLGHLSGQLDDIKSQLQGVTGSGLDTRLEQMSVAFNKGFGAKGVMSGLEGVKNEAFGVALALNRDADAVAETALAFRKMGVDAYSVKEMQQIVEATTLSGEQFAGVFQDLNKSWGLGEAGTKEFLDKFTSVNVQLGQGQEAFKNLPGMMEAIGKSFTKLDMKPEDIKGTILSMSKLGAVLSQTLGVDVNEAQQQSVAMFTALAEEGNAFDKMTAGMEGGLGQLTTELAQMGGGLEESLKVMQAGAKDPAQFMLGLTQTIAGLTESGNPAAETIKKRLLGALEQINPSFAYLSKITGESVTKFEDIMKVSDKTGQTLTGVAKAGFHTGLTLEESIDKARMSMEQAFGGASREERVAFANSMIKSYNLVGTTVSNLTGKSEKFAEAWRKQAAGMGMSAQSADKVRGVLGPVVEYMATFASTGVHGVLLKMFGEDSVLAGAFGVLASGIGQLLPMLLPLIAAGPAILGVVAPAFTWLSAALSGVLAPLAAVAGPVLAVAAAIGVLYLAATGKLPAIIQGIKTGIETAFKYVAGIGTKVFTGIGDFFSSLDGEALAKRAIGFIKDAIKGIFGLFNTQFKSDPAVKTSAQSLYDAFVYAVTSVFKFGKDFATTIYDEISTQVSQTDWKALFQSASSSIKTGLVDAFNKALEIRKEIFDRVNTALTSVDWKALFSDMGEKFLEARHVVAEKLKEVFSTATEELKNIDFEAAGQAVGAAVVDGIKMGGELLLNIGTILGDLLLEGFNILTTPQFWIDTVTVAWEALKLAATAVLKIGDFIRGLFSGADAEAEAGILSAFDFGAILESAGSAFGDVRSWVTEKLVSAFDTLTTEIQNIDWVSVGLEVGDLLGDALVGAFKGIAFVGGLIYDGIASFASMSVALGALALQFVTGAFKTLFTAKFWQDSFSVIWSGLKLALSAVTGIGEFIAGIFGGIGRKAADAMFGPGTFDTGLQSVIDAVTGLQTVFDNLWLAIKTGAEMLFGNSINTYVAHDFGIIQEILATAQTWFGTFKDVAQSVFSFLMTPFSFFIEKFKAVGELLSGLASYFGFTPEKVAEVTSKAGAPAGASTSAAAAQVSRAGDSYLAQVIIEQHSKDRAVLESIYKRLSATGGEGPVQMTAVSLAQPTTTGKR